MKPSDLIGGFNWNPTSKGFTNRIIRLCRIVIIKLVKMQDT